MHAISADVRASFPLELTTIPAQEQFQSSAAAYPMRIVFVLLCPITKGSADTPPLFPTA
jgi:hypothetical protein